MYPTRRVSKKEDENNMKVIWICELKMEMKGIPSRNLAGSVSRSSRDQTINSLTDHNRENTSAFLVSARCVRGLHTLGIALWQSFCEHTTRLQTRGQEVTATLLSGFNCRVVLSAIVRSCASPALRC